MRMIHIESYDYETMKLAKPIYDSQKRILLASGRHIHPKFLERLQGMKVDCLIIDDIPSRGITLDEMIDMPTWMDAIQVVQHAYEAAEKKQKLDIMSIQATIAKLIQEVQKRKVIVLIPTNTIASELQPYAHAVNVTLLSIQIGMRLGMNQIKLKDLGIGALLHDIGKAVSSDEKEHPQAGFQILRSEREISLLSAHVAFGHHEVLDGTGYPRGVKNTDVHEFAQICGVANLFENNLSNVQQPPHETMEYLMSKSDIHYEMKIIHALVQGIPSYPPGTKVVLNTNEEAIVTKIEGHMQRPVVRLLHSEKEISLENSPTLLINKVVSGQ